MILKALKLATVVNRRPQRLFLDLPVQCEQRIFRAAFQQDLHCRQHCLDAPPGALAKLAMAFVKRVTAATQQARDVLLMHRDQMIEQRLMRFHHNTDQQCRPGSGSEASECLCIVAARQFSQMLDDGRRIPLRSKCVTPSEATSRYRSR